MKDAKCPKEYRLLMQLVDAKTQDEGRAELLRIFGSKKASAAVLVPGVVVAQNSQAPWGFHEVAKGFRAYIPGDGRAT